MARVQCPFLVQDPGTGATVNGASVTIKVRDTNTLAQLYVSESGGTQSNPVSTNNGQIPAWADPGSYDLTITGSNFIAQRTWEAVRGDSAPVITKTFRIAHTWHFPGTVGAETGPNDLTNYLMPFYVGQSLGQTSKIVGYRGSIGTGTSATLNVTQNGSVITGYSGIVLTTSDGGLFPGLITVAQGDKIKPVVTAVSGSPGNLAFTLFIEHTV